MLAAVIAFLKALPELLKTGRWTWTEIKKSREESKAEEEKRRADDEVNSHF